MIRQGRREDIEALLNIYNDEIEYGTATFDLEKKGIEEWTAWYEEHSGIYTLLVWEESGTAVGYATLSPYREKEAYLGTVELSVYVHRGYQGRGIGTALMQEMLNTARRTPEIHTVVSVITGSNEGSLRLHERLGFTYCGRVREAGFKFGRYLDIDTYQIIVSDARGTKRKSNIRKLDVFS